MNSLDKKYIVGTIIVGLILLSLEITAYSVDDNYSSFIFYEERKIITELEFSSSKINENDSKIMHIKIFDEISFNSILSELFKIIFGFLVLIFIEIFFKSKCNFTFFRSISKSLFCFLIWSFIIKLNFDVVNPKYAKYPMKSKNKINIKINIFKKFLII